MLDAARQGSRRQAIRRRDRSGRGFDLLRLDREAGMLVQLLRRLEDVHPIGRELPAAGPVIELRTVRSRGIVVFTPGHGARCLGIDARTHGRLIVGDMGVFGCRRLRFDRPRAPSESGHHRCSSMTAVGNRMGSSSPVSVPRVIGAMTMNMMRENNASVCADVHTHIRPAWRA